MERTIKTPFWRWRCVGGRWSIVNVRLPQKPNYGLWVGAKR